MALFNNELSVIRQYLSTVVGDLILSTATTPLDTEYYTDSSLTKAEDYYNQHKYRGYCYYGTAIGQEREVYDWVFANHMILFAPIFSPTIADGDKFELHYIFTEGDYRQAINLAIEASAGKYVIDKIDETITLVADTYEYTLPASMSFVHKVTTEHTADTGKFYDSDEIDIRDWDIISPRTLKLRHGYYSITAGKDLRIEGQGRQDALTSDIDVCYLPLDWVVQKAITFLPQNKIQSNQLDNTYRQALVISAREPRNYPTPEARRVVD